MADALRSDDHKTVSAATAQLVWQIHLDHASRDRQAARYWKYLADYLLAKQATPPMPAPTTSAREAAVAMLSATATRADLNPTGHAEESVEIESCLALLTRLEKNRTGDKAVPAPRGRPTGLARTFDRASRHGRDGAASDPTGASIADQFQFSGGGLPTH